MPTKKQKYIVVARNSETVEFVVEATSHVQATNIVYEGNAEPLKFYNEELEVIDTFLAADYEK
jgi:hypothetical protein